MVSYLVPWLFLLFWAQCTHAQSNPFYHPFYPDVTHVRKDTRPSPALPYWKRQKAGWGLDTRLFHAANLSVEHCEGCPTGHALCHCLVVDPCSHGDLLLFQFICMLPEGHLLSVRVCSEGVMVCSVWGLRVCSVSVCIRVCSVSV